LAGLTQGTTDETALYLARFACGGLGKLSRALAVDGHVTMMVQVPDSFDPMNGNPIPA
jgi:hypothetical protein